MSSFNKDFERYIRKLAYASLLPHSDPIAFVTSVCSFNISKETYLWLVEFYVLNDKPELVIMIEQKLAIMNPDITEERFEI